MEDTLRDNFKQIKQIILCSLNPCSNGRYSQSEKTFFLLHPKAKVLTLVLMEDTLRVTTSDSGDDLWIVLILVLMEDTLRAA